ncbi:transposase [Actinomadura luteofluorescens]|uniref:transposase n=1 Tax=Actinomadura luteofluorescens TaxID=46163 RepID=UPI00349B5DF6
MDAHADWLQVFYLPAYAPDLNPAESVWSLLKRSVVNFLATDLDQRRPIQNLPVRDQPIL